MRTLLAATGIAVAATILGVGTYASQSDTVPSPAPTTSLAVDDNGGTTDRDDRVEPGDDRDSDTYTEDYEDADEDSWDDAEDRWDDSGHND